VALEVRASSAGIEHLLLVPRSWLSVVENCCRRVHQAFDMSKLNITHQARFVESREYRISTHDRALRTEPEDHSAKLLTSLQPLAKDETITVQWLLAPAAPVAPARMVSGAERDQLVWARWRAATR